MKKLRTFAVSMIVAALGLLIYCGGFFIRSYKQNLAAKQGYEEIADIAVTAEKENKKDLNRKTKDVQDMSDTQDKDASEKKNLRKINSQVAAWITIPGADISYPVVQGTDDEYYLNHNFRKAEDLFGCIFLEHNNKKDLTGSHSIIYGHNMEGNMMFANLNRYEQPEFLKSCPEIEILTPERKFLYKIFSVEQASSQSAAFEYGYELSSPAYKLQLTELKNNSMYDTGIEPEESAPVVTLVTCNSHLDKEIRMAVHGSCYEIINSV